MARNEIHDASRKRRLQTCDNDAIAPWSDLSHDVLLLVMMQLSGVVDFVAFSGVCKSWRSLALYNRNNFMVSRPPMYIRISSESSEKDCYCHLQDSKGNKFKTIIPHSAGRTCVGFTCGYMVFFGSKTRDFWLVNPITRHELYFPDIPSLENDNYPSRIMAILVYSPSTSGLVFAVLCAFTTTIWFSVVGTGAWNHVITSTLFIKELHFFKGKIYTVVNGGHLCELRFDPEPKLTLLEMKNSLNTTFFWYMQLVTLGENLCMSSLVSYKEFQELDFGEMKWMPPENRKVEYALFVTQLRYGNAFKPGSESWADPRTQYERYASFIDTTTGTRRKRSLLL